MNRYFRGTWDHNNTDDPRLLYYEVDTEDSVTRMIEVFESGKRTLDSVQWHEAHALRGINSLVEGGFISELPKKFDSNLYCDEISEEEFESAWKLESPESENKP